MKNLQLLLTLCLFNLISFAQNNSLHFDGVDDYVLGPSSPILELDQGTIELWVKPEMKTTKQTFICYRDAGGWSTRYLFNFLGNLSGLGFWNGAGYETKGYSFTANQWYHLAFVDNNSGTNVFINGNLEFSFSQEFSTASGSGLNVVLGVDIPLSEYFYGEMDEVRIWSRPFCPEEVQEFMDCEIPVNQPDLLLHYKFDQGVPSGNNASVSNLDDHTGNNFDGSLTNFTLNGSTSNWVNSTTVISNCNTGITCPPLSAIEIVRDCYPYDYPTTLSYLETWRPNLTVDGVYGANTTPIDPTSVVWTSSNSSIVEVLPSGKLLAKIAGTAVVTAQFGSVTDMVTVTVEAPILPPEIGNIDPYLAAPHPDAIKEVPVVIIRYLPTADGINIDVGHVPNFWSLGPITVADMKSDLDAYDQRIKFTMEEGTRFRDYGQNVTTPYLGFKVVEFITVYEPTPRGKEFYTDSNGFPVYEIDYFSMFDRFNIQDFVNNQGVKEVWLWDYGSDSNLPSYDPTINFPCNFRAGNESNMASPITGDVSNSYQDPNDLPIYNSTYILYNQNPRRTQAEAIHNRGHQFERMFPYVNQIQFGNTDLFWNDFVGVDPNSGVVPGRCGWTHMPPNTASDYDYYNTTIVDSDIEDWIPDNTGVKIPTNNSIWENKPYNWPGIQPFGQQGESHFYLYWMQSFPGLNNNIPYGTDQKMSNWWEIYCDWDDAIINGKGLVKDVCSSNFITLPNPTPTGSYFKTGPLVNNGSIVLSGNDVELISDVSIDLEVGTYVLPGAEFHAFIGDCYSGSSLKPSVDLEKVRMAPPVKMKVCCERHRVPKKK